MPDQQRKIPIPAVMNVAEFMAQFGSEQACLEHLRKVRWGQNLERFACPADGNGGQSPITRTSRPNRASSFLPLNEVWKACGPEARGLAS